ncbi:MAG: FliH/SctL family protein [Melioribacteraceae bacterium]
MSSVIKLNISTKKIRAIVSDSDKELNGFTEYSESLKKEAIETATQKEVDEAYTSGYEKGKQEVTEKLEQFYEAELLRKTEEFYKIISTIEAQIKNYGNDFNKLVITTSKRISEKIIGRELESKTIIEETLQKSIHKIIGANEIIVKLNPSDFELIQNEKTIQKFNSGITHIKFEAVSSIEKGGCFVETEIGNLDARISSQINEIVKNLENKLVKLEVE